MHCLEIINYMLRVSLEYKSNSNNHMCEHAEPVGDDKDNYEEIVNKKCDI